MSRAGSMRMALAWSTLAGTFAVLVAGALVNAQQAALSVPTWPLSYGHLLLPEWVGNTFYEQLHRLLVAVTGLLYVALAWSGRRAADHRVTHLLGTGLALLATQVLLGGGVVLWLDPPLVAALHLLLAIAVVLVTACLTFRLATPGGVRSLLPVDAKNRRRARRLLALVVLELVLGAVSRHPPFGQSAFIVTLLAHALNGLVIVGLALVLGISELRRSTRRGGRFLGWGLALLALGQLGVGLWVFWISPEPLDEAWPPPAGFPTAHALHIALATLLTLALSALARRENEGDKGREGKRRTTTASEFRDSPP